MLLQNAGPEQPCNTDDPTCYCVPSGDCFPYKQEIRIDHCDIDRYKGDDFQLKFVYVVINGAGKESPGEVAVQSLFNNNDSQTQTTNTTTTTYQKSSIGLYQSSKLFHYYLADVIVHSCTVTVNT